MKKEMLRFLPVLVLILVACNLVNAGSATAPVPAATSTPTNIPSPAVTLPPIPGDLGFGNVTGTVTDAASGLPIPNATVTCQHSSYTSKESDRCNRTTTTDQEGIFLFEKIFFHDTDSIQLSVEAPGYEKADVRQGFFTWNEWKVDIALKAMQ